jgi:ATP-dependent exoDNAse (exonuclease V) alpha subunit
MPVTLRVRARCVRSRSGSPHRSAPSSTPRSRRSPAPERLAVLIGPAGTGKGIVIDAAARAEEHAGRTVLGIAVSGSTAERLGTDTPSLNGRTLTLDSLVARARTGGIHVDQATTIFLAEAGMAAHQRLDALTGLVERSGAKFIAVGDGKQLPSIGPGGMFDRLSQHAPTAELTDIYRTNDPAEQRAWQALRAGEPERAMAHYVLRNQLHFQDTRTMAGEAAVQRWHALTQQHGAREVALIADASNQEIDRLNARAQHLRSEHGELGHHTLQHPDRHYGLHQGDLIAFTKQHRPPGQPRVENGSRGEITAITPRGITIALDGSDRHINLHQEHLDAIRLGYAQHVYRQQGATVERSVVLTGGWQTSKESAYVEATRARHGTDWYLARDQLGEQGQDPHRIRRLAEHMRSSRAQTPSLALQERADTGWEPSRDPLRLHTSRFLTRLLAHTRHPSEPDRSADRGR